MSFFESTRAVSEPETVFFWSGSMACQKEQVLPPVLVLWGARWWCPGWLSWAVLTVAALSPDGGDKDARDSVQMWLEQRLRAGLEDGSMSGQHIGTFERHTKVGEPCLPLRAGQEGLGPQDGGRRRRRRRGIGRGKMRVGFVQQVCDGFLLSQGFGRKVLEQQGWTEGLGLGSSNSGMAEALDNEGQNPRCKRGLG